MDQNQKNRDETQSGLSYLRDELRLSPEEARDLYSIIHTPVGRSMLIDAARWRASRTK